MKAQQYSLKPSKLQLCAMWSPFQLEEDWFRDSLSLLYKKHLYNSARKISEIRRILSQWPTHANQPSYLCLNRPPAGAWIESPAAEYNSSEKFLTKSWVSLHSVWFACVFVRWYIRWEVSQGCVLCQFDSRMYDGHSLWCQWTIHCENEQKLFMLHYLYLYL